MNATFAVVFPTLTAAGLLSMAAVGFEFNEKWGSREALAGMGSLAALTALILELIIRRQIWLARHGHVTRGTISEIRRLSNRNDNHIAIYYFAAPGQSAIESRARISEALSEVLRQGSEVQVIFDPNNPHRNELVDSL